MTAEVNTKVKSNIAFIGTGWIGLNRMKSLLDQDIATAVAVLDPDAVNAKAAAQAAPGAIIARSFDELLSVKPEAVVIATPSAMHASQCMTALENGMAVFCQKPLARTAEETGQVISAAHRADKLLGVDLSYRYTDGMQKIFESRDDLGKVYAVDLVFNNAYGPDKSWFFNRKLSGGGCLIDLGVHLIDLALWMLDFPAVSKVTSTLFSRGKMFEYDNSETVEDYVSAQLETVTGVMIRLVCSWNLPAGQAAEIHASFFGTKASALFYNINGSFYDFEAVLCRGTSRKIISHPPDDWGGRALTKWALLLQEGTHFRNSAFEYYESASVIDRIYRKN
jgi:predicted dehydrogenase